VNENAHRWLRWWPLVATLAGLGGAGFVLTYRGESHMADVAIHMTAAERQIRDRDMAAIKNILCRLIEEHGIMSADCPPLDRTDP